jgi:predicted acetyltransferase
LENPVKLVVPALAYLESYTDALRRGWSPDNLRPEAARDELAWIAEDPATFVALLADDRDAKGGPVILPDGSQVTRLPSYRRWMWDGEFCGSLGFRWRPGTEELPAYVLGHIGYGVVAWKRQRGYATRALALLLDEVRAEGLGHVELTTELDNESSQKVILANGGVLVDRFRKADAHGGTESLRFRIALAS